MKKRVEIPPIPIEELFLKYELEPTMKDVIVEGPYDRSIIQWFIKSVIPDGQNVAVILIDDIKMPGNILPKYNLTAGNRSDVVAFCMELQACADKIHASVTGLVDSDCYSIVEGDHQCSFLLKSDYSSIEMYLFSQECLGKVLALGYPKVKFTYPEVALQLFHILRELFLMRAASLSLKAGIKWLPFNNFLSFENNKLAFRIEDYKTKYLSGGGARIGRKDFDYEIERLRGKISGDFRHSAQGHDAIEVLSFFLKKLHTKAEDIERTTPDVLVTVLTCALEAAELIKFPMFQSLERRLNRRA